MDSLPRLLIKLVQVNNLLHESHEIDETIKCPVDFKVLQKEQQKVNITGDKSILGHTQLQTMNKKGN